MKRKFIIVLTLVVGLALAITTVAFAKQVTYYLTGEVTAIADPPETVDIMTSDGYTVTVTLPGDFMGVLELGYTASFKGIWKDGGFEANQVLDFYLEGVITAVDLISGTITIDLGDGVPIIVTIPDGYEGELTEFAIVHLLGTWVEVEEGVWVFEATWVEVVDPDDEVVYDYGGRGGIHCDGSRMKTHPVAIKIAGMYGWVNPEAAGSEDGDTPDLEINPEWVMEQFCAGFGFGEIMHALILAEGDGYFARFILSERVDKGWGQIWKELGLMKNDKGSDPPPGWLKKPDKLNNPPPGWEKKLDKVKNTPPGLANKPEKVKGPKK